MKIEVSNVIEEDGKKFIEFDPGQHQFVPSSKVDEIRSQSYAQGAKKAEEQIAAKDQELSNIREQLEAATKGKGAGSIEVTELRQKLNETQTNLTNLTQQMEQTRKAEAEARFENLLKDKAVTMKLKDGGADTFQIYAKQAKIRLEDGSEGYQLPDGGIGNLDQFAEKWSDSSVGRAFVLSGEKGGAGSLPSDVSHADFGAIMASPELKRKYVEKHGMAGFSKRLAQHRQQTKQLSSS